ncbi:M2 family metallopeptidase [Polyangium sp. 15x6]|uniref:M2 family metallopeptidase n=1 Tax=Polyangium sp. 15x6 TaxID=3042687 RepID=UPI00249A5EFF|nr:M2 family metallopeptidase [Polyangium sp. 15x6]MDI3290727.1 M2 family metallopeptidase [Polyangium sp. 15x6]
MKQHPYAALALVLPLAAAVFACSSESPPSPQGTAASAPAPGKTQAPAAEKPPTAEEAHGFTLRVNDDLKKLWTASARAAWVNKTYITDDTTALSAAAEEANMEYLGTAITGATRFDGLKLDEPVARQLKLIKLSSTLPAPPDAKKRSELAQIAVSMEADYGKGKYCPPRLEGKCLNLDELSNIMAKSRKYDELLDAWTGWHSIAPPIKERYTRYVELGNEGARSIGFSDMGALWRAGYDMTPEAFEADTERLWTQVKPLYDELHCLVRSKLRKLYGEDKIAAKAPIPAHLLGNMWAQDWSNIYDLVTPYPKEASIDVTKALVDKKVGAIEMAKMGERFFTSLGLESLPKTFWERSMFVRPRDREVVCHASAWDVTYAGDIRIKMCIEPKEEDFITIHHELGHNYYYVYYHTLPVLFQSGANDGFHEGIGDTIALSVTPGYLKTIGLLKDAPENPKAETNFLMKQALSKIAFLPFGKLIDQWRWDVFAGKTAPDKYNEAWWNLRQKYQGVAAPVPRSEKDFDPGAKFHVPGGTPYTRYFLAHIYQFQFHRALCKAAGHTGPLHTCSIYGNKAAGDKLKAMLAMGASKPWPEAMKAISGETQGDASAILEYFEPLRKWIREESKGETCGW